MQVPGLDIFARILGKRLFSVTSITETLLPRNRKGTFEHVLKSGIVEVSSLEES